MSGLKENKIEQFAFDYLQHLYATLPATQDVLTARDQHTKKGHTADGLFASFTQDQNFFIASLSLSQSDKLSQLLLNFKKNGLSKYRYGTAATGLGIAFLIVANTVGAGFLAWAGVMAAAIVVFLLHSLLEWHLLKRSIYKMTALLAKIPADQKWLGLSMSSLCFRNNDLADYMLQVCEQRGIGVITVGKRAKVVVVKEPKTVKCRRGDFLSHYVAEEQIRASLRNAKHLKVA